MLSLLPWKQTLRLLVTQAILVTLGTIAFYCFEHCIEDTSQPLQQWGLKMQSREFCDSLIEELMLQNWKDQNKDKNTTKLQLTPMINRCRKVTQTFLRKKSDLRCNFRTKDFLHWVYFSAMSMYGIGKLYLNSYKNKNNNNNNNDTN